MSPKENAAIHQLLALLEARYAMRVLWALRDGHPQTFRLLQDSVALRKVCIRLAVSFSPGRPPSAPRRAAGRPGA